MRLKQLMLYMLLTAIPFGGMSQAKLLKEADGLYYTKRYMEAYHLYEKIYEKKKDKPIALKMAECNYNVENYPVALGYYNEYFTDTFYHALPEYVNYANSARLSGKIDLSTRLYTKINQNAGDASVRTILEIFKFYLDSANKIRVYNLDSVYSCIDLDASESLDREAAPMSYLWDFKDGTTAEGIQVTHCFKSPGRHELMLSIRDKATGYVKMNDTTIVIYIDSPPVQFSVTKRPRQFFYTTFDASTLDIPGYDILEYIWDLGVGELRLGKKIQFKYTKLEECTVKLTVVAKNKFTGKRELMASCRNIEVVDNYSDHSKTFKDNLKEDK